MVAFGMDDELAKTVGFEKAAELSENPEYVTGMMNKIESGDAAEDEAEQPDEEIWKDQKAAKSGITYTSKKILPLPIR